MEGLENQQRTRTKFVHGVQGHTTGSARYGLIIAAGNTEAKILEAPVLTLHRLPLQNADGQRYFIPDIDTPGDTNHPVR